MSYRHPRYHNQKTLLEPYQAMALALFVLIPLPLAILFIAGAANSAPLVHSNASLRLSLPLANSSEPVHGVAGRISSMR